MNRPTNIRHVSIAGIALVLILAAFLAGRYLSIPAANDLPAEREAVGAQQDPSAWSVAQGEEATRRHLRDGIKAGDIDPVTGLRVLYYSDPMSPSRRFEQPGKSPFMDMMLVPRYAGSAHDDAGSGDLSGVTVSARMAQNIGLRTAPVLRETLSSRLSAVGNVRWNERDQAVVQARAVGFVEKLHVRALLDPVQEGQPLLDMYVPDWVAVQEEFIAVQALRDSALKPLLQASRSRMRQAGMSEALIEQVASSGQVQARVTLLAPIAGVLTELLVREGGTVMAGDALARINGTRRVWAEAQVPETQASALREGDAVEARSSAWPDTVFAGQIQALLPQIDTLTRTRTVRVELDNADGRLLADMFVTMQFAASEQTSQPSALTIPSEAIIHTGKRTVVMRLQEDGSFMPQIIRLGRERDGRSEILLGLREGDQVVSSGQFLLDSEASLRGLEARLNTGDTAAPSDNTSAEDKSAETSESSAHSEHLHANHAQGDQP